MICKHILLITFLNKPEFSFLYTIKWFQEFPYNSNNLTSVNVFGIYLDRYTDMICK